MDPIASFRFLITFCIRWPIVTKTTPGLELGHPYLHLVAGLGPMARGVDNSALIANPNRRPIRTNSKVDKA